MLRWLRTPLPENLNRIVRMSKIGEDRSSVHGMSETGCYRSILESRSGCPGLERSRGVCHEEYMNKTRLVEPINELDQVIL